MYILENIESDFIISRRIYAVLYQDICHTFQEILQSLDFDETQALNLGIQANDGGLLPIENYTDAIELLQVFDLFYYMNGRFPFTTGLLPVPDGNFPAFVGDQKLLMKNLYLSLFLFIRIDNDINIDDIFIDDDGLFDQENIKQEDREYIEDLSRKKNFAEAGNLIPDTLIPLIKKKLKSQF